MSRVAIFRTDLLPISETFIRDQASALAHWHPILVGFRNLRGGLETPGIQRQIVQVGSSVSGTFQFWLARPNPHLIRHLKAMKVNLVHAHFGTDATDIWPSVKAAGLPMLVTLHGYDINIHREWWEAGNGGLRRRVYPRRLLRMAEDPTVRFIAVSKAIKDRAIKYGIPEEKVTIAYIGINTQRFTPGGLPLDQRCNRILFVGRMVENKAPMLMVRAFARVRAITPDAELVMIGNGPLLGEAKKLAVDLNVPVIFLGACSSIEVLAQLREAKMLCLTSVIAANGSSEGFGLVLLEAQCCGVPVISSALGGTTEALLDGITGYTFKAGNMAELVDRISILFDDPAKVASMSAAASAFVTEHFDIAKLSRNLEEIYSSNSANITCA